MTQHQTSPNEKSTETSAASDKRKLVNRLIENDLIGRVNFDAYKKEVRHVYDGPKGALLSTASLLSGHLAFGERLLKRRKFDLRGCQRILDVGSGAGQILKHLLKYADPTARLTGFDLSHEMLKRARKRLNSNRASLVTADLTRLPFRDDSFDCITCGYVLEHLPDPRPGLSELARVLSAGGRMLLIVTEDTFGGAWTSRFWLCRTYNRVELRKTCEELGLHWNRELWFSGVHQALRAGGICVEIVKRSLPASGQSDAR